VIGASCVTTTGKRLDDRRGVTGEFEEEEEDRVEFEPRDCRDIFKLDE
jgi:hypothetical protein